MNRIIHFEIQAENPERAIEFYKKIFGWDFQRWGDPEYWVIMTAPKDSKEPGINGGLLPRPAETPPHYCGANAFVCTVEVADYDQMEKKILAAGGIVAMPKFAIKNMAWQGYFVDTEGNTFGIHQPDENAE